MVEIRGLSIDTIPDMLGLVEHYWTFEGIEGFDENRLAAQLRRLVVTSRLGSGWIAYLDGRPVGYLLAVYVFSLEHFGLTAEIDEVFIEGEHRREGIGKALLAAAEATFARTECTHVSLQLGKTNDTARQFYLRHGFVERSDFELLEKPLQPSKPHRTVD